MPRRKQNRDYVWLRRKNGSGNAVVIHRLRGSFFFLVQKVFNFFSHASCIFVIFLCKADGIQCAICRANKTKAAMAATAAEKNNRWIVSICMNVENDREKKSVSMPGVIWNKSRGKVTAAPVQLSRKRNSRIIRRRSRCRMTWKSASNHDDTSFFSFISGFIFSSQLNSH